MKTKNARCLSLLVSGLSVAGLGVLLSGCVLPVPHYREHLPEQEGLVVDSRTKQPIADAEIDFRLGRYRGQTRTDDAGRFKIESTGGWHWIYWFTASDHGSWFPTHNYPEDDYCWQTRVSAPGYQFLDAGHPKSRLALNAIRNPSIRSELFTLSMPGLEKSVWTGAWFLPHLENLARPGKPRTSWDADDLQSLHDCVRARIEATERFGHAVTDAASKGGLALEVRIVQNEWRTDGAEFRPTCSLVVHVEVTAVGAVLEMANPARGRGTCELVVSWGSPSNIPIDVESYNYAVSAAVYEALLDLH